MECHEILLLEKWYHQLCASSPTPCSGRKSRGSKYYIGRLFPERQLLSVGTWLRDFRTGFADELFTTFPKMGLIVPGYMTKRWGMTLGDPEKGVLPHPSPRCKENTGRNEYIIFRTSRVGLDEQARRIIQFAREYRLAMVVLATPDVLEAWFPIRGFTKVKIGLIEKKARGFSLYGSASQPWRPCAVPDGYSFDHRDGSYGEKQNVIFFDKAALQPAKVSP